MSGPEAVAAVWSLSGERSEHDAASGRFSVGDRHYRVRRLDPAGYRVQNEVDVEPREALAILEQAISQQPTNGRLVRLLETAMTHLAGLHDGGVYVLSWLQPWSRFEGVATPMPTPAPPPPRSPAKSREVADPPRIEEPMMPPAQATALKSAADLGVPFCEECARAAAQ